MKGIALALVLALFAADVAAQTASNPTAFPLPNTNELFPVRSNRLSFKCFNPTTNAAVTLTYASGLVLVLQPGGALWETMRPPQGKVSATGTAGQTVACEEQYQ